MRWFGPKHDLVAARLEVGGRLLDLRAGLRRARRRDDGDRRARSGSAGGLIAQSRSALHPTASIASAISSRDAPQRAEHELDVQLGHRSSSSGPLGVEPQRDPGALQEDRVGRRRAGRMDAQRAVADPGADQLAEDRPGRRRAGRSARARGSVGERADLAVGDERRARWRPWKTTCSRTAAASLSAGSLLSRHRSPATLLGQPLHEVVLEADQDRLLARVPVVDRGRLDAARPRRSPASRSRGSRARRTARSPRSSIASRVARAASAPGGRQRRGCSAKARAAPSPAPGSATSRPSVRASPTAISTRAAFDGASTPRLM